MVLSTSTKSSGAGSVAGSTPTVTSLGLDSFNAVQFPILCQVLVPATEATPDTLLAPRAKRGKVKADQVSNRESSETHEKKLIEVLPDPGRYYAEVPSGPTGDFTLSKSKQPESDWGYCFYLQQHVTLANSDNSGLEFQLKIGNHPAITESNPRKSARTTMLEGLHLTSAETRGFTCLYLEVFLEGSLIADKIIDFLDKDNVNIANEIYDLRGTDKLIIGDVKPDMIKFRPIFKNGKEIGGRKLRFPPKKVDGSASNAPNLERDEDLNECIMLKSSQTCIALPNVATSSETEIEQLSGLQGGIQDLDEISLNTTTTKAQNDKTASVLNPEAEPRTNVSNIQFDDWEHPPPPGFLLYQQLQAEQNAPFSMSPTSLNQPPAAPRDVEKHDLGIPPHAIAVLLPQINGKSTLELVYWIGKETKKFYKPPAPPQGSAPPSNRRVCKHGKAYWLQKYPNEDSKLKMEQVPLDVAAAEPTEEEIESGVSERQEDGKTTLMLYRTTHVKFLRSWAEPSIVHEIRFSYEEGKSSGKGRWIDGIWWKAIDEWPFNVTDSGSKP